jgi:hypothetical protein
MLKKVPTSLRTLWLSFQPTSWSANQQWLNLTKTQSVLIHQKVHNNQRKLGLLAFGNRGRCLFPRNDHEFKTGVTLKLGLSA